MSKKKEETKPLEKEHSKSDETADAVDIPSEEVASFELSIFMAMSLNENVSVGTPGFWDKRAESGKEIALGKEGEGTARRPQVLRWELSLFWRMRHIAPTAGSSFSLSNML